MSSALLFVAYLRRFDFRIDDGDCDTLLLRAVYD
jgi:hypothetical protein